MQRKEEGGGGCGGHWWPMFSTTFALLYLSTAFSVPTDREESVFPAVLLSGDNHLLLSVACRQSGLRWAKKHVGDLKRIPKRPWFTACFRCNSYYIGYNWLEKPISYIVYVLCLRCTRTDSKVLWTGARWAPAKSCVFASVTQSSLKVHYVSQPLQLWLHCQIWDAKVVNTPSVCPSRVKTKWWLMYRCSISVF